VADRPLTLALSTCWNARRHRTAGTLLDELAALGARQVELAYCTPNLLPTMAEALALRGMAVASIHNACPWPLDPAGERMHWSVPDGLASADEERRSWALALARESIAWAERLGAGVVILHMGQIETTVGQGELFDLLRLGKRSEFEGLRARALAERAARAPAHVARAIAAACELGEEAARRGVALGLEVRDCYDEIPNLDEMLQMLEATAGLPIGYWHDVGHAEKQHLLGLAGPHEYLQRFADRLLGVHLHDGLYERDHMAPGFGRIDLQAMARLLPVGVRRTLELDERVSTDEAVAGLAYLRSLGLA